MKKIGFILLFIWIQSSVWAQSELLQSGPMVGYSTMREVALWVQTRSEAKVHFEYWDKTNPARRLKTDVHQTQKSSAYAVTILADRLEPGRTYAYELIINGKKIDRPYPMEFKSQLLWQGRTDPPTFSFALGSCAYVNDSIYDRPGKPYGGGYEIFVSIAKAKPDFMVWGGDNVYLREADYDSRTGIFYRYTHARSLPELQPLLASVHHYAIWDDHDFGPNDSDRGYPLKKITEEVFKVFWPATNYGAATQGEGIYSSFVWGDCQFFLLDNRFFRTPNLDKSSKNRTILGEQQMQWLLDGLTYSHATFKFIVIGGQVLNPAAYYENYATYSSEREALIRAIRLTQAKGVFFLSGDRHHTVLTKLTEAEGVYPLYDLTVSPLTSSPHLTPETNLLAVEGTMVKERNFALLSVSGAKDNRQLKIQIMATDGRLIWEKTIAASELR